MRIFLLDIDTSGHRIEYAKYLSSYFINQGHCVYYYTCGNDTRLSKLEEIGVEISTYPKKPNLNSYTEIFRHQYILLRYYQSAFSIADSWNADIVHQLSMGSDEVVLLAQLLRNRSSNWKFFGTYFSVRFNTTQMSIFKKLFRTARKYSLNTIIDLDLINGVFVHSEILKERLTQLYPCDFNISVIPDPIDPPTLDKSQLKNREEISLPEDDIIFLFFGSTRKSKGADILLRSLSNLNEDVTVVFAGEADYLNSKEIKNISKHLNENITIIDRLEFIPDDDVYKYFYAADAITLPYRSQYNGTSGVLQRSIAAQRPVIGTNCGIVGNIINEWGVGISVEPDSEKEFSKGIKQYLHNKSKFDESVSKASEKYIKVHHKDEMARQVLDMYLSC